MIQAKHEICVLKKLQKWYENDGKQLDIIDRPDPPDAIISIDGKNTWVEITDVFLSKELAESITTYAHDKKQHKPVPFECRIVLEPEETFEENFHIVVEKKFTKITMKKCCSEYGPGILIIGLNSPFLSGPKDIVDFAKKTIRKLSSKHGKIFSKVFLYEPHSNPALIPLSW